MNKRIVGIDEAGRGPLAGPVAVGVCVLSPDVDLSVFGVIRDSKKLTEKQREKIFTVMKSLKAKGKIDYTVALVSSIVIDRVGIVGAIGMGLAHALKKLKLDPDGLFVYLDGGLKAPDEFMQETVIKGDEKIPVISLASIAAKVVRDRHMKQLALTYPEYGFEVHKGYGTKKHIEVIRKRGLSNAHRRSFCRSF